MFYDNLVECNCSSVKNTK